MTFLYRYTIKTRLIITFGLVLAMVGILIAMAIGGNKQNRDSVDILVHNVYERLEIIKNIDSLTKENARNTLELFLVTADGRTKVKERIKMVREQLDGLFSTLAAMPLEAEQKVQLDILKAKRQVFVDDLSVAAKMLDTGLDEDASFYVILKVIPALHELESPLRALAAHYTDKAHVEAGKVHENSISMQGQMLTMGLVVLGILLLSAWTLVRSIMRPLQVAMAVTNDIAQGDLTVTVPVDGKDEIAQMMHSLLHMKDSLSHVLSHVQSSTYSVATASQQIAIANADLSARTEIQASAVQQTASSMEQLSGTVKINTQNTYETHQLATQATHAANEAGELIRHLVVTMDGILHSSEQITKIVAVIDGIAFQTNILALNAAVEAARAGEQGRGFAVVASEVRALSQRSATAAQQIKEIIQNNINQVQAGNKVVLRAGTSVETAIDTICKVGVAMTEIEEASRDQSSGISQIGHAVNSMDNSTQQNAALVEETAAAAQSLDDQVQALKTHITRFKIPDARPPQVLSLTAA